MAEAQIKVALNALARTGVEIREHDDRGNDVGEVVELAKGSKTFSLKEGHSVVIIPGAANEPTKGKQPESTVVTLSVEKDSTHAAKVEMTQGIAALDSRQVTAAADVRFTLENDARLRITRGAQDEDRVEPEAEPAAS